MTPSIRHLPALLVLVPCLGLAACGGDGDDGNQRSVPTRAEAERAIDAKYTKLMRQQVTKVTCPQEIPSEEGATFRCTAAFITGDEIPVEGRIGDDGAAAYERLGLLMRRLEQVIRASVTRPGGYGAGRATGVTCPRSRAIKTGDMFTCRVVVEGRRSRTIYVTQRRLGQVSLSPNKPNPG
jgi:hypothetical protein